ncbi:MAG TPA: aminodeoxychorismate lyase [Gammaproteobacteria bacterium]|nr:aminodeoxychorismate lyase [Gammaproteobacteria bacterium]
MNTASWVNGKPQDQVLVSDRGLQYGDGVFETLPTTHGQIPLLAHHLDRLYAGCERLGIKAPLRAKLQAELLNMARGEQHVVFKLLITRGAGGRGYRPPPDAQATRILTRHPWPNHPPTWSEAGIQLRVCRTRLGRNPRLAGVKHLNRLEQVLARAEWSEREPWQEGLMLDEEGAVIEGTMTNVFARLADGRRITPELSQCGVAGVMRRHLLERSMQDGEPVHEVHLSLGELQGAREVFVCNSLIDIWPVRRLDNQEYAVGEWTRRMQHWARDAGTGVTCKPT